MIRPAVRNRLIIAAVVLAAGGVITYQMFFSLTPPRHADHDHAMATLDAGGFLWVEPADGRRRNLVGPPGQVLVLHWFDAATPATGEQLAAARFALSDPAGAEVLLIGAAPSWDALERWATEHEVPSEDLYLDRDGATAELIGVRRFPETLFYDPSGLLAHQARGPMSWTPAALRSRIATYAEGVEEIH